MTDSSSEDSKPRADPTETTMPRYQKLTAAWRARYEGSFAHDLIRGLGAVDFSDRL
jgi:hypothetical protein